MIHVEDTIFARLNPESAFSYVCENEKSESDHTTFFVRPLTVFEYKQCESQNLDNKGIGRFSLMALTQGLVGWDNFRYSDNNEVIPFDLANIDAIPSEYQIELSSFILSTSEVPDELQENIKSVIQINDYLSNQNPDIWDCSTCKHQKIRNCNGDQPNWCPKCREKTFEEFCPTCTAPGKGRVRSVPHYKVIIHGKQYTRCPLATMDKLAIKCVNLINYIEGAKALPFGGGAMAQTNFFYSLRMTVLSEQNHMLKMEMDSISNKAPKTTSAKKR